MTKICCCFVRRPLRVEGYVNIKTTPDSRGVLAHFVEEDPDILILDVTMPHLDGFQLLGLLQESVRADLSLPVLMTSSISTPERKHLALERGAVDLIEKPFEMADFLLRVRNLLKVRLAYRELEDRNRVLFDALLERSDELSSYRMQLKETQLEVISRLGARGRTTRRRHRQAHATRGRDFGFAGAGVEPGQRESGSHSKGRAAARCRKNWRLRFDFAQARQTDGR